MLSQMLLQNFRFMASACLLSIPAVIFFLEMSGGDKLQLPIQRNSSCSAWGPIYLLPHGYSVAKWAITMERKEDKFPGTESISTKNHRQQDWALLKEAVTLSRISEFLRPMTSVYFWLPFPPFSTMGVNILVALSITTLQLQHCMLNVWGQTTAPFNSHVFILI